MLGTAEQAGADGTAWRAALATAAFAVALGAPLVVVAATTDHLEHPMVAAALRAAWIGLYAAVGLWFGRTPVYYTHLTLPTN